MHRRTLPGSPPDFERLVAGLFRLRRLGYGTAFAFIAIGAIGLRNNVWTISAVLAVVGLFAGTGLRDSRFRLIAGLVTDHVVALALWWMIGPGSMIDLIPVIVVALTAFVLPLRMAAFTILVGEVMIAARIPLHIVGSESTLPLYWANDQISTADVITSALGLMALAIAAAAVFLSVGRLLERSRTQLEGSELRYRTLVEASPDGILIHQRGIIRFVNEAAAELLGYGDPAAALNVPYLDHVAPADRQGEIDRMHLVATGEAPELARIRFNRIDGSELVAEAVSIPTELEGSPAIQMVIKDITESIGAQELLRSSEQRYRQLFERIPVAMYRSTPDGQILALNPALIEMMGFDQGSDLLTLASHDVYVDPTARSQWIEEIDKNGTVIAFEAQLRKKDGTTFWGQDSARTVTAIDGTVLYYEGAIIDVTAQKFAEQAQQRLTRIIEATPDIVVVLDPSGWITYANSAARSYFSIDENQPPPYLHVSQALDRDTMRLLIGEVIPRLRNGQVWTGEIDLQAADGSTMPVSAVGLTHHAPDGSVARFSAVLRDVSGQVEATRQLEDLVRTKDEFVASVSHELRTPLTAVVGLAQELRDHWKTFEEDELHELIKLIADQGAEVSSIVQDLLVAARADIGSITINPTLFRVSNEVESAIKTLPQELAGRVGLDVGPVDAWADPGRFRQIIRNLVTNALRYGGPNVRVHAHNGDGKAVVAVSDDGAGIAESDRARIFDPYFRAHDDPTQPASVGLGLTVSRQLAELMNGELVYNYQDGLSTFTVRLPIENAQ